MPVYDYKCGKCDSQWDEFRPVADRDSVFCCEERAKRLISAPSRPVILEYYNESIDRNITGPKQRDALYKELDVHEVGDNATSRR